MNNLQIMFLNEISWENGNNWHFIQDIKYTPQENDSIAKKPVPTAAS